jgi:hypothetical protein
MFVPVNDMAKRALLRIIAASLPAGIQPNAILFDREASVLRHAARRRNV